MRARVLTPARTEPRPPLFDLSAHIALPTTSPSSGRFALRNDAPGQDRTSASAGPGAHLPQDEIDAERMAPNEMMVQRMSTGRLMVVEGDSSLSVVGSKDGTATTRRGTPAVT